MPEQPPDLRGRGVLLTRPQGQGEALAQHLQNLGVTVIELPLLAIEPAGDPEAQRKTLQALREAYGWIFTSIHAVKAAAQLDPGPWPSLFAIGPATAAALAALGHVSVQTPPQGHTSEDLLRHPHWADVSGKSVLLCSGVGGRDHLQEALRSRGAQVQKLELYRRRDIQYPPVQLEHCLRSVDAIACTSAQSLQNLYEQTPAALQDLLRSRSLVVPSMRVLELAERLGFAEVRVPRQLDDVAWADCLTRPHPGSPRNPSPSADMTDQPATPETEAVAASTPAATPTPDTATAATPAATSTPSPRPAAPATDRGRGTGVVVGFLILLLLAVIGLAAYGAWLGWQRYTGIEAQRLEQAQELRQLQTEVQDLSSQLETLSTRQSDLSRLGDRQGTELAALQVRIDDGLQLMSRISEDLSGGRTRFALSSVEQLLLLANDRLLLHRDVRSALAALDSADERLAALSDPQLFPVREAVAAERNALRAVPQPDLASAVLSLSSLIDRVPQLPLTSHAPAVFVSPSAREAASGTAEQALGWQRFVVAVKSAAQSLFTVRRDDDARALRQLAPEQEALVYHVLILKLEGARAALLSGRSVPMREALVSASAWIDAEFKSDDAGVRAAQVELQRLQALELSPPLPDISRSLEALRARLGDDAQ